MDVWNTIAERKIREAMEEGAFDNLAGCGRPIDLREDPFEDPSLRMAHRLLRNNGFAPAWVEERRELERDIAAASGSGASIAAINRRIRDHNLKTRSPLLHLPLLQPGE